MFTCSICLHNEQSLQCKPDLISQRGHPVAADAGGTGGDVWGCCVGHVEGHLPLIMSIYTSQQSSGEDLPCGSMHKRGQPHIPAGLYLCHYVPLASVLPSLWLCPAKSYHVLQPAPAPVPPQWAKAVQRVQGRSWRGSFLACSEHGCGDPLVPARDSVGILLSLTHRAASSQPQHCPLWSPSTSHLYALHYSTRLASIEIAE